MVQSFNNSFAFLKTRHTGHFVCCFSPVLFNAVLPRRNRRGSASFISYWWVYFGKNNYAT